MADPTLALHKAVFAWLSSNAGVPVYDGVPDNTPYPYVVMEDMDANNTDLLNTRLDSRTIYISIWSRGGGSAESLGIIENIDNINGKRLSLDTGRIALMRVERKRTDRQRDNRTYRGQVALRIITTH